MEKRVEKSKEQILAERQAKKSAKKQNKSGTDEKATASPSPQLKLVQSTSSVEKSNPEKTSPILKPASPLKKTTPHSQKTPPAEAVSTETPEKSREQVIAEREAKKLAKQSAKKKGNDENQKTESAPQQKREIIKSNSDVELSQKLEKLHISAEPTSEVKETPPVSEKGKLISKAERRAIQEAQRAAKMKAQHEKVVVKSAPKTPVKSETKAKEVKHAIQNPHHSKILSSGAHKVKQFKHLYTEKCNLNIDVNGRLHPAIVKLGVQYANDAIVGSNSRCYAFLNALKTVSSLNL